MMHGPPLCRVPRCFPSFRAQTDSTIFHRMASLSGGHQQCGRRSSWMFATSYLGPIKFPCCLLRLDSEPACGLPLKIGCPTSYARLHSHMNLGPSIWTYSGPGEFEHFSNPTAGLSMGKGDQAFARLHMKRVSTLRV